jgi:CheY-like chemotaxis protein
MTRHSYVGGLPVLKESGKANLLIAKGETSDAPQQLRLEVDVQNTALLILVVEDEQGIRELVDDALSEGGFDAQIASSGEEAISLLQPKKSHFCALVTDIHLGGEITGWVVAKRAREVNPEIPVVYITGAGAAEWPSLGVPNSVLLNKPFAPAQVVTAVSQLLNHMPPPHD